MCTPSCVKVTSLFRESIILCCGKCVILIVVCKMVSLIFIRIISLGKNTCLMCDKY